MNSPSGYQRCKEKKKMKDVLKAFGKARDQRLKLIEDGSMALNHFAQVDMLDQSYVSNLQNGLKVRTFYGQDEI